MCITKERLNSMIMVTQAYESLLLPELLVSCCIGLKCLQRSDSQSQNFSMVSVGMGFDQAFDSST